MTIKELSKIRNLKKEIDVIKRQIENTTPARVEFGKYETDKVKGSYLCFPYTERSFRVSGCEQYNYEGYYNKLSRLQKNLSDKLEELMDTVNEATDYIDTIDDSVVRMVLTLKYINGLTWEQIGAEIGYSRVAVRKKHAKFFKKQKCIT